MEIEIQKICSKCKVPKSLDKFHKRKNGKYGRDHHCKECASAYGKNKYATDIEYKERACRRRRKNSFNLNDVELDKLMLIKNCQICGNEFKSGKDKHIDHDHNTMKIRGVLCSKCNLSLGHYESNKNRFEYYLSHNMQR